MPFDGLVINSLSKELSSTIIGGRVDKIYQPEEDELIIHLRNNAQNYKLLITSNSSNPRIHLTDFSSKSNPSSPPMFCMLLRKHLIGGHILNVSQFKFERIVYIDIENYDELRIKKTKRLIIEIMGKHSNIILIDLESNKIIDSIKRVPIHVSSVRQILPGKQYIDPPNQGKLNPLDIIDFSVFKESIENKSTSIFKALYTSFEGISPTIAKEIVYRSNIDLDLYTKNLDSYEIERIFNSFNRLFSQASKNIYYPCLIIDKRLDKLIDFSSIKLTIYNEFSTQEDSSMSKIIDTYYFQKDVKERIKQKSSDLRKNISNQLDRLYKKTTKLQEELSISKTANEYKRKGELLTSYIYMMKTGMESIRVIDFFDLENKEVQIDLSSNLTPSENIQKYFKKYSKLKTASIELSKQLEISMSEIMYLENIILSIENSESIVDIEDIIEELVSEGYLKKSKKSQKKNEIKKNNTNTAIVPYKFISSDGFIIYVGKNNKQNDYLTLKIADSDDLWFHTKNIPGSHVIIKKENREISDTAITEAALLAAYFSKGKYSSQVPVDYVIKKHVKKPKGSKPGMVIYENNKTIYTTPSEENFIKIRNNE